MKIAKTTMAFMFICGTVLALIASGYGFQTRAEREAQWRKRIDDQVQPERLVERIGVKPGMIIGEAGAGAGYFTFYLARKVSSLGHIYANDILSLPLENLKKAQPGEGVDNITTLLGEVDDPLFPVKDLDMIVMLYAYHEFESKVAWLKNARRYLKPGAPLVILDFSDDDGRELPKDEVENEAREAGYELTLFERFRPLLNIFMFRAS